MKPKTKAFADKLIASPKLSNTDAYLATHETNNRTTARVNASILMSKPSVKIYLKKHEERAKKILLDVMENSAVLKDEPAHAKIASDNARDILDRNLGKALTRTNTTNLNINIEEALQNLV